MSQIPSHLPRRAAPHQGHTVRKDIDVMDLEMHIIPSHLPRRAAPHQGHAVRKDIDVMDLEMHIITSIDNQLHPFY